MKLGLIGKELGHSKSPQLFEERLASMQGSYSLCSCKTIEDVAFYLSQDYDGFNVTMPYKSHIISLLDEIDTEAEAVGAVNTLVRW